MPALAVVTEEQIIEAGERLQAEGKVVTGWVIRGALGAGKGTRLCEIWDAHQARQTPMPPPVSPLPEALQTLLDVLTTKQVDELSSAVNAAWTTAERLVTERLGGEVQAQRLKVEHAESSLSAAQGAIDEAEVERDGALAEVERLKIGLNDALQNHIKIEIIARSAADRADRSESTVRDLSAKLRASDEERGRLQGLLEGARSSKSKAAISA